MTNSTPRKFPYNADSKRLTAWKENHLVIYEETTIALEKIQLLALKLASRQMQDPGLVTEKEQANIRNKLAAVVYTRTAIHKMMARDSEL